MLAPALFPNAKAHTVRAGPGAAENAAKRFGLTDLNTAYAGPLQVSSVNSQNVHALFTSLFARMLATIPGIPQELASLAVQQAKEVRDS